MLMGIFTQYDSVFTSLHESITGKDSHNTVKVLVWCYDFNTGDKVYMVVRAGDSGLWGFSGGHVHVGEDPAVGGCREVKEEVGIILDPKDMKHLFTIPRSKGKGYIAVAECQYRTPNIPPHIVQREPDNGFKRPEVMEIRWVSSLKDLRTLPWNDTSSKFINWDRDLIEARLKKRRSTNELDYEGSHDEYFPR